MTKKYINDNLWINITFSHKKFCCDKNLSLNNDFFCGTLEAKSTPSLLSFNYIHGWKYSTNIFHSLNKEKAIMSLIIYLCTCTLS